MENNKVSAFWPVMVVIGCIFGFFVAGKPPVMLAYGWVVAGMIAMLREFIRG